MKKLNLFLLVILIPALTLWTSCGETTEDTGSDKKKEVAVEVNHTQLLLDKIVENGDFINTKLVPTMIPADKVHANLENNFLVLDLRNAKDFAEGHIKGAVNVKLGDLLDYFKANDTKAFEKVVMVCYSGQTASYAASALQLLGNKNVYAMKWGMCSWNDKFAGKWLNGISDKYADKLEIASNDKAAPGELPKFDCMKTNGGEILNARVEKILKQGLHKFLVTADVAFANPADYYIINYWPEKSYIVGHIPSAIRYQPKTSLKTTADLLTIPKDKKILIYCYTGQHSAFVTAYLRILGYDAYSLKFGANSFMNTMLKENEDLGHGFSKKAINKFEFETSEYTAEEAVTE